MTIGQLAKITDVNIQTIRYYENLKLIAKPKSKYSKHRVYSNEYIDRINYIKKAKELGFTLKEIKDILRFDDCKDLYDLTGRKLDETQKKLELYTQLAKKLKSLLKTCPKSGSIENCSIIKSISKK
jgi:MerR family transcriptional regulator, mercuric resistance operon regulatory protein